MKRFWIQAIVALCAVSSVSLLSHCRAAIVTLDFTTDDGGMPLVHGQAISTGPGVHGPDSVSEFGNLVNVSTTVGAGGHLGAVIFDTTPGGPGATLGDPDLDLLVDRGNILTLQDWRSPNRDDWGVGGNGVVFRNPDDVREGDAGRIVFDFLQPIAPISVDLVDADYLFGMDVILTDIHGGSRTYIVPEKWTFDIEKEGPNGFDTLVLNAIMGQNGEGPGADGIEGTADDFTTVVDVNLDDQNVTRIEFTFRGNIAGGWSSGGIDNLTFSSIPEPSTIAILAMALGVGLVARRGTWCR